MFTHFREYHQHHLCIQIMYIVYTYHHHCEVCIHLTQAIQTLGLYQVENAAETKEEQKNTRKESNG